MVVVFETRIVLPKEQAMHQFVMFECLFAFSVIIKLYGGSSLQNIVIRPSFSSVTSILQGCYGVKSDPIL